MAIGMCHGFHDIHSIPLEPAAASNRQQKPNAASGHRGTNHGIKQSGTCRFIKTLDRPTSEWYFMLQLSCDMDSPPPSKKQKIWF
mmetsp:Transcript_59296/g.117510  ORF Transcript_59296/g.117510 Transcript_59296/m.117510 type:complete len:85 (+) Transcript_59296:365-619(+)